MYSEIRGTINNEKIHKKFPKSYSSNVYLAQILDGFKNIRVDEHKQIIDYLNFIDKLEKYLIENNDGEKYKIHIDRLNTKHLNLSITSIYINDEQFNIDIEVLHAYDIPNC